MDERQIADALKTLGDKQIRILTGTVTGASIATNPQTIPVLLDNDSAGSAEAVPVSIPSICGLIPTNTRVSILTVPPAGMIIIGTIGVDTGTMLPSFGLAERSAQLQWTVPQFFLVGGVWNKPTDPLFLGVMVTIQSGGGGSGGTGAAAAATSVVSGGGQGGGYVRAYCTAANLADTATVVVGAGGLGAAAGNNVGGTGGTGSFTSGASFLSIPGGVGGSGGVATATTQTTSLGGSSNQLAAVIATNFTTVDYAQGDDGGTGFRVGSGASGVIWPGAGGGSRMGGNTGTGAVVVNATDTQIGPVLGWILGGGASGRGVNAFAAGGGIAAGTGAAGAQGVVIVESIYRT